MERNNISSIIEFVESSNLSREEERSLWVEEVNRLLKSYEALDNLINHAINWDSEHHVGYFGSFERKNKI